MNHQAAIAVEVFTFAGDDDLRVRHFGGNEWLGADEVFQSLVFPDAPEEQNRGFLVVRRRAIRRTAEADVRDNVHDLGGKSALPDKNLLHLLRVHDQPRSPPKTEVHDRLRRFPRDPVADVVARVVCRHDERIPSQEWQDRVEPEVPVLQVNDIRGERVDLTDQRAAEEELTPWMTQPRLVKRVKRDLRIEFREIRRRHVARQHEQHRRETG